MAVQVRKTRRDKGVRKNSLTGRIEGDGRKILAALRSLQTRRKKTVWFWLQEVAAEIGRLYPEVYHNRKQDDGPDDSIQNQVSRIVEKFLLPEGKLKKKFLSGRVYYSLATEDLLS